MMIKSKTQIKNEMSKISYEADLLNKKFHNLWGANTVKTNKIFSTVEVFDDLVNQYPDIVMWMEGYANAEFNLEDRLKASATLTNKNAIVESNTIVDIDILSIFLDQENQRETDIEECIYKIIKYGGFDWSQFDGYIEVFIRKDGTIVCSDGGHRLLMAWLCGITSVPCLVVRDWRDERFADMTPHDTLLREKLSFYKNFEKKVLDEAYAVSTSADLGDEDSKRMMKFAKNTGMNIANRNPDGITLRKPGQIKTHYVDVKKDGKVGIYRKAPSEYVGKGKNIEPDFKKALEIIRDAKNLRPITKGHEVPEALTRAIARATQTVVELGYSRKSYFNFVEGYLNDKTQEYDIHEYISTDNTKVQECEDLAILERFGVEKDTIAKLKKDWLITKVYQGIAS